MFRLLLVFILFSSIIVSLLTGYNTLLYTSPQVQLQYDAPKAITPRTLKKTKALLEAPNQLYRQSILEANYSRLVKNPNIDFNTVASDGVILQWTGRDPALKPLFFVFNAQRHSLEGNAIEAFSFLNSLEALQQQQAYPNRTIYALFTKRDSVEQVTFKAMKSLNIHPDFVLKNAPTQLVSTKIAPNQNLMFLGCIPSYHYKISAPQACKKIAPILHQATVNYGSPGVKLLTNYMGPELPLRSKIAFSNQGLLHFFYSNQLQKLSNYTALLQEVYVLCASDSVLNIASNQALPLKNTEKGLAVKQYPYQDPFALLKTQSYRFIGGVIQQIYSGATVVPAPNNLTASNLFYAQSGAYYYTFSPASKALKEKGNLGTSTLPTCTAFYERLLNKLLTY